MNEVIQDYVEKYSKEIQDLFTELRELIIKSVIFEVEEKLWAKLPSFYVGNNFVRIIPFKDHVNIQASAVINHKAQLEQYKITPKGMLQIHLNQDIPYATLISIFTESLT